MSRWQMYIAMNCCFEALQFARQAWWTAGATAKMGPECTLDATPKNISCMRRTKVLQGNRSEVQDRRKPGHLTRHPFVDEEHIDRGFDFPQSIVLCCRLLATCNLMRLIQLSCTCSQFPRPWSLLEPRENAKGLALRKIVLLSGWSWCGDEALTKSLQGWCALLFYPWWQGHRLRDINI